MSVGPHDEGDLERQAFILDEREHAVDEFERQLIERERLIDRRERAADEHELALERWEQGSDRREEAQAGGTRQPDRSAAGAAASSAGAAGRLSEVVADTARRLLVPGDPGATLDRSARLVREITPGCAAATVVLREGRSVATVASSDTLGVRLDAIQRTIGRGPGLRVLEPDGPTWVDGGDRRAWEPFASRAERFGVGGFLSFGLIAQRARGGDRLGSLNLYGPQEDAFDEEAHDIALMVAAHLTIVVVAQRERAALDQREQRMQRALSSRDVIGQAKGILMERQQLSADAAFDVLRRASQRTNTRLQQVAQGIVDCRPGGGPGSVVTRSPRPRSTRR